MYLLQDMKIGARPFDDVAAKDAEPTMRNSVKHLVHIPVALSQSNTGLASKFAAIIWASRVSAQWGVDVSGICKQDFSWTTDMGSEFGLHRPMANPEQMLPF